MTASGVSQVLFSLILLSVLKSFGLQPIGKNCEYNSRKDSLHKLANNSKELFSKLNKDQTICEIPNDPRKPIDRIANPDYNPIGAIKTEIGRGTAWLANECLVFTNKHVVGAHKKIIGKKVTFSVGQSDSSDSAFKYNIEGTVVASGNPDPKNGEGDSISQDWALIKLKSSVGRKVGYIEPAQYSIEDALTCKTIEIAGFPGEKRLDTLWWQTNCQVYTDFSGPGAFNIGCPATFGNSGGPLLCRESDDSLVAIGIVMQLYSKRPDAESFAVNFTVDWQNVKKEFLKYKKGCPQD